LVEPVDTTSEQPIDDLATRVKQVVLSDWFQGWNLVFKGGSNFLLCINDWLKPTGNQWGSITPRLF
jgi:hypothetical protein